VCVHHAVRGGLIFMHVRNIAKGTISFVMSVCQSALSSDRPHGTTRLRLHGFSRSLVFECFSNICSYNSSFIKIW